MLALAPEQVQHVLSSYSDDAWRRLYAVLPGTWADCWHAGELEGRASARGGESTVQEVTELRRESVSGYEAE